MRIGTESAGVALRKRRIQEKIFDETSMERSTDSYPPDQQLSRDNFWGDDLFHRQCRHALCPLRMTT
jgi:hypothetical protein